jgi:endonuclease/exonuclease/phosphatase family metal-dependent hydrolase
VGILFDSRRVRASEAVTYAEMNPYGEACKNQLRPGLGAHFSFAGGLDLHVVSVHLKSGGERRSLDLRARSLANFPAVVSRTQAQVNDEDVLVMGDFNSMGCSHCSPSVTADAERASLDAELERMAPAMSLVSPASQCSEYHRGSGTLLDIMAVTKSMQETASTAKLRVSGVCGELRCAPLPNRATPSALAELSDHCPVYVDLTDRDLD